jgi:hypothetical protein
MHCRTCLLTAAALLFVAAVPAVAARSKTEVALAARLTDAQERLARAETTITALRAEASASGEAADQKRHAETLAKLAATNDAIGTLRGMAFEIQQLLIDNQAAAASRNTRPAAVTASPAISPRMPSVSDVIAKKRHEETLATVEQTNTELEQVLAMSAGIQRLVTASEASQARRTKLVADRNAAAALAERLQVLMACALVLQFALLGGIYRRIRRK